MDLMTNIATILLRYFIQEITSEQAYEEIEVAIHG